MKNTVLMALVFMTILLSSKDGFGQEKWEKESRINSEEVPVISLVFVDSLNFTRKVKWYREEGLAGVSIEAKSKKEGHKISVEFDSTGNIEDIEIQVEWKTLSDGLKDRINTQLDQECLRHKIQKVQIQYSGEPTALLNKMNNGNQSGAVKTNYELVIKCKTTDGVALYEYLVSYEGQVI